MQSPTEYLTVREMASMVRLHPQTVYNLIWKGRVKARKVGGQYRISREYVRALLGEKIPTVALMDNTEASHDFR